MSNTNVIMNRVKDFLDELITDFQVLERDGYFIQANDVTANDKICEIECVGVDFEQLSTGRLIKQFYTIDVTLTIFGPNAPKSESELEQISNVLVAKSVSLAEGWVGDVKSFFEQTYKLPAGKIEIEMDLPLHEPESNHKNLPCTSVLLTFKIPLIDCYGEDY